MESLAGSGFARPMRIRFVQERFSLAGDALEKNVQILMAERGKVTDGDERQGMYVHRAREGIDFDQSRGFDPALKRTDVCPTGDPQILLGKAPRFTREP